MWEHLGGSLSLGEFRLKVKGGWFAASDLLE